jgi:6-phosphofructokinase 2
VAEPIVTLTLNPALDIASEAHGVRPGHKARTTNEHIDPGGGGINVARTIHVLGGNVLAVMLAGGLTGNYLQELLAEEGVLTRAVPIAGRTRLSITIHDRANGDELRFVAEGPEVTAAECTAVLSELDALPWRWLVASGSLPRGVADDFYNQIARLAHARGGHFALDTSGSALLRTEGATLIKPSLSELSFLAGHNLNDRAAQIAAARDLIAKNVTTMVALTLGSEGAVLITADDAWMMPALPVIEQSSVGAGDAFLGAMVMALAAGEPPEQALGWGIAAGAAAASGMGTARLSRPGFENLRAQTQGRAVRL